MSQLRRGKQRARRERDLKIKRQKTILSVGFVFTIIISFSMLIVCAVNNAPTLTTTIVSGSVWLLFDILFAYAIKKKWFVLFDECNNGRLSFNYTEREPERRKNNWEGNICKFVTSVVILLIHLVLFFILL